MLNMNYFYQLRILQWIHHPCLLKEHKVTCNQYFLKLISGMDFPLHIQCKKQTKKQNTKNKTTKIKTI